MKTHYAITLAMLAGFGLGTIAVQGLHAQAKPPVYQVTEIEILNPEAYSKDYVPKARAAIQAAGGKFLAVGGKTTALDGEPPKSRIVIQQLTETRQGISSLEFNQSVDCENPHARIWIAQ